MTARPISGADARHLLRILAGADRDQQTDILASVQEGCSVTVAGLTISADDDAQTYMLDAPPSPEQRRELGLAPRAYLDVFAPLDTLEAAAWLEAIKQAGELVEATSPYEADWLGELEELRAEARRVFERKFFEVRQ